MRKYFALCFLLAAEGLFIFFDKSIATFLIKPVSVAQLI